MANLASALKAAGASLTDVLKTTIYVASGDRSDLVAAWDVIRAEFGEHDAPSTLLGGVILGYPGQLVEIEAVAAVKLRIEEALGDPGESPRDPSGVG